MDEYLPVLTLGEETNFPAKLRWGGSEDSDGIAIPVYFEKLPVFCEIYFAEDDAKLNLMIEINGRWFYKKQGVHSIDLISAFFEDNTAALINSASQIKEITLKIFAPPPEGVNDPAQGNDWELNYYAEIKEPPNLRIRYAPAMSI